MSLKVNRLVLLSACSVCLGFAGNTAVATARDTTPTYAEKAKAECAEQGMTWRDGEYGEGCYDESGGRYYTDAELDAGIDGGDEGIDGDYLAGRDDEFGSTADTTEASKENKPSNYQRSGGSTSDPCAEGGVQPQTGSRSSTSSRARTGAPDTTDPKADQSSPASGGEESRSSGRDGTSSGGSSSSTQDPCTEAAASGGSTEQVGKESQPCFDEAYEALKGGLFCAGGVVIGGIVIADIAGGTKITGLMVGEMLVAGGLVMDCRDAIKHGLKAYGCYNGGSR